LIPASTECSIELDDRCQLLALQRGEIELASKETALRIEHLEIAVEASLVPVGRQPSGIAQGRHELLLLRALLARLVVMTSVISRIDDGHHVLFITLIMYSVK
jgi:hypothetical protein